MSGIMQSQVTQPFLTGSLNKGCSPERLFKPVRFTTKISQGKYGPAGFGCFMMPANMCIRADI